MICENCIQTYSDFDYCPWCERRREELLERLRPDEGVVGYSTVAGWALVGFKETPERCWRVG